MDSNNQSHLGHSGTMMRCQSPFASFVDLELDQIQDGQLRVSNWVLKSLSMAGDSSLGAAAEV